VGRKDREVKRGPATLAVKRARRANPARKSCKRRGTKRGAREMVEK